MTDEKDTWGDYSKLVLKELERLNDNYDKMRNDMDTKFNELNIRLNDIKGVESKVSSHASWIERVNDVWSPTQMKEAKDEIYKQKSKWIATVAVITFVQITIGIAITIWSKLH